MSSLVGIGEWNKAVKAAGGDEVAAVLGYRHSRRLPADNPIFAPLQKLLRERGEWHGTAVQLQRALRDKRYPTAFGRLLQQAVPFLAREFRWEKHTMPRWGVVQFFARKESAKCRTRGCQGQALARGRCWDCFSYLHRTTPGWMDDVDLDRVRPCCFEECGNDLDEECYDGDFPLCAYHWRCVQMAMLLDEDHGYTLEDMIWDGEWLMARYFHELRRHATPEDRPGFDRIYGNTPLFKMFLQFFDRYDPVLSAC